MGDLPELEVDSNLGENEAQQAAPHVEGKPSGRHLQGWGNSWSTFETKRKRERVHSIETKNGEKRGLEPSKNFEGGKSRELSSKVSLQGRGQRGHILQSFGGGEKAAFVQKKEIR